jgi:HK97 family phage major capsid protein
MRIILALVEAIAWCFRALWREFDSPALPRVIRHNLHPFMKRSYGKLLAGGRSFSLIFNSAAVLRSAAVLVLLIGLGFMAAKVMALNSAYSLAMPSLLVTSRELKEERATLINENRALVDRAEAEKREFTAEEQTQYDARFVKINELGNRSTRLESQAALEDGLEQRGNHKPPVTTTTSESRVYRPESRIAGGIRRDYRLGTTEDQDRSEIADLERYMRSGRPSAEQRAMQADSDTEGGFIATPQQFVADLIQNVDDLLFIRQYATVEQVPTADSLGRPTLDTDLNDADWTSELGTGSLDESMRFGKRELKPHPLAKRTKISRTLVRKAAIDIVGKVRERLAYKFASTQEKGFLTGDSVNKPLGMFVASNDGIPTSRDIATGNTATAVTFDGLKEAKWGLKQQYHAAARWIAHRDFAKMVDKIKDGEGRYVWQASVLAGTPDTLLNFPLHLSEFAPNTFTSGLYAAILGDISFYHIAEALSFEVQTLLELYAETNQVGYIGRAEIDGMPALAEAFVRVKLG